MKSKLLIACGALLVVMLTLSAAELAMAAVPGANDQLLQNNLLPRDNGRREEAEVSRRQASDLARQRFDGRVLNIRRERNNWRVRMDREGTVFNVFVNASSGFVSRPSN